MESDERDALERLEDQIKRAAQEIRRLRDDNKSLRAGRSKGESQDADAIAWNEERVEIRRRVESLADGLEKLLAG